MNMMDRVDRLRRLYRRGGHRNPARFVSVPESALLELARAMELVERHAGHVGEVKSVWIPRAPMMNFSFDDELAKLKMRQMVDAGQVFLFGLQAQMGDFLAVGWKDSPPRSRLP